VSVIFLNECSKNLVRFKNLRIWAERGLIHFEHTKDGAYHSESVREVLLRLNGLQDMLRNSRQAMRDNGFIDFLEFDEQQRAVEEVGELCALAQQQGMPSDPQAAGELHRRLPKYYVVPGATDQM
jgi:hypothetical protein